MNIKEDKPNPTDIKGDNYLWGTRLSFCLYDFSQCFSFNCHL